MLYVVASYHWMKFQEKIMNQTWENLKNLVMGQLLVPFTKIWDQKKFTRRFYIYLVLDIIASYQCMQFQGKLMNQTWENWKEASSEPNCGPLGQNFICRFDVY